jgi:hypothetical protein
MVPAACDYVALSFLQICRAPELFRSRPELEFELVAHRDTELTEG